MKFQVGDSVTMDKSVGLIIKASPVESAESPGRQVFAVRFSDNPSAAVTYVWSGGVQPHLWALCDSSLDTPRAIMRGKQVLWTS